MNIWTKLCRFLSLPLLIPAFLCFSFFSSSVAMAKDFENFDLNIKFHIAVPDSTYNDTVDWLKKNITVAEKLFNNNPKLRISPTFVRTSHEKITTVTNSGVTTTFLGFANEKELEKFMDDNYDNVARTKTDGHMSAIVVDNIVQNIKKDKGLCGKAVFPHWVNPFKRKRGMLLATCDSDKYLLAHELGHYLSLKHSFEPYVNFDPFSQKNCNKEFGNHTKCNSCQGQIEIGKKGDSGKCKGISNVMDYCSSTIGKETLNACQLVRSANQRNKFLTKDGEVNYIKLAGLRGEGACEKDSECRSGEYCTAGVLDLSRNVCKPLKTHGVTCTDKRQCASDRCSWGFCADADECRADNDCNAGQFCGDPISGKRSCKSLKSHGQGCTKADQCTTGRCSWGFCADADECRADSDCTSSQFCGDPVSGKRSCKSLKSHGQTCTKADQCTTGRCSWGFCADADECRADSDCTSSQFCGDPVSGKRSCKSLKSHGQACTKADQCTTGRCSWGFCADADECRANKDCKSGQFCGDPISGKRKCKSLLSKGKACTKGIQCASGKCTWLTCK